MAFGQQSGPPATQRQVRELLELLNEAGHRDFRDARGPMGFTQRQAGGKFTRDEADAFIEQLQLDAELGAAREDDDGAAVAPDAAAPPASPRRAASAARATPRPKAPRPTPGARPNAAAAAPDLADVPDGDLAAELQRRGWIVVEP